MAGELPRTAVPGVDAELALLRNRVEGPDELAGARVERPHVARRIVLVHQPIADAVAEDDEILVDDRRRRVGVVLLVDGPDEALAEIDDAVLAEAFNRLSSLRIELDQAIPRVEEDAQLSATCPERSRGVAPRGHAAVRKPLAVWRLPVFVGLRIVAPQLLARRRLDRGDDVVGRADVEDAVDHQRRVLKRAGPRAELRQRLVAGHPLPGDLQLADIRRRDLVERGVVRRRQVARVMRPLAGARRLRARDLQCEADTSDD